VLRAPITTRSALDATQDEVWTHVTTVDGINDELRPWLRMTAPRSLRANGLAEVRVGERICRSWVLLLGVLPIDYDDITLERLDPPNGFLERSTMLSQKAWQHERTIEPGPDGGGCILTDRISYEPRVAVPDAILRGLYAAIFAHRHRRLRRRFGGRAAAREDG
jgi:ligand-binding SRPBCC domain-containing protein